MHLYIKSVRREGPEFNMLQSFISFWRLMVLLCFLSFISSSTHILGSTRRNGLWDWCSNLFYIVWYRARSQQWVYVIATFFKFLRIWSFILLAARSQIYHRWEKIYLLYDASSRSDDDLDLKELNIFLRIVVFRHYLINQSESFQVVNSLNCSARYQVCRWQNAELMEFTFAFFVQFMLSRYTSQTRERNTNKLRCIERKFIIHYRVNWRGRRDSA
jgi:hypothetical protein